MTPETEQQYKNQIAALQAEIEKLKNQQTKAIQREKYGLNWIDVPEEFDEKSKNSIPVLIEDKNKAIKNADGKPTHVLIEGDNYHALTCLNYTHAGKIDVIYIDPPYNTGSDGFTYKDARFMTEFPNGKPVPKDDPLRHSTWLSFMEKRLRLAKNLLSDKGVIFISIDDNEQANLKLLCDQIFGEKNFVAQIIWQSTGGSNTGSSIITVTEYIFVIAKKIENIKIKLLEKNKENYKLKDKYFLERGKFYLQKLDGKFTPSHYSESLSYPIKFNNREIWPGGGTKKSNELWNWRWSKSKVEWGIENGFIDFIESKNQITVKFKNYEFVDNQGNKRVPSVPPKNIIGTELCTTATGTSELYEILGNDLFSFPKNSTLIKYLCNLIDLNSSTILDFFAGSGTTLHATMKLNAEDGGNRQCILVQQKENDANICETITYERNRRVMQGYTNAKGEEIAGLGNSLKYYKTDFIGENKPEKATDEDRISLAQKAGYLISLVENTLEEIETNDFYQIFSDAEENKFTAIYFNGDTEKFPDFVQSIQEKNKKTTVYIFTWGSPDIFENEFDDLSNITIKSIPQPILEIYKSLMKNEE